jgi:glycosyltransferase involved in cell wall biosynthesis
VWETEPGIRERFPSPLHDDATAFVEWLRTARSSGLAIPEHVPDVVAARSAGRSIARVASRVMADWGLQTLAPCAFVGVDSDVLARALLAALCHELEYDTDDVVAFLWTVDIEPWRGVDVTLELPIHRVRVPSTYDERGQDDVLASVIDRPGIRAALAAHRERRSTERHLARPGPDGPGCVVPSVRQLDNGPRLARVEPIPAAGLHHGVNLFGPTRSPIGLGTMARGLAAAVRSSGLPVAENVQGSDALDADVSLGDLLGTYDHRLDTNIFVTVPHFHERPFGFHSRRVLEGRRNIAYLAWEQRDHHPDWREVFADFDDIWSLSTFAADALARAMDRPVLTVPCVVDLAEFPPPTSKADVGLGADECHYLYVFDANSSIARKNPEAAIAAFGAAFDRSVPARLLLRVSNGHRRVHQPRLQRLRALAAECGARVSFVTGDLERPQLLGLLSAVDAYVSLHRAEGFGYTCAEAMAVGTPVIASRYSGNLDFMDDTNSLLVDCNEVEVTEADGPFVRGSRWAEPSLDHAVEHLRAVYRGGVPADLVGRARSTVETLLSPTAVAATIAGRLGLGGQR